MKQEIKLFLETALRILNWDLICVVFCLFFIYIVCFVVNFCDKCIFLFCNMLLLNKKCLLLYYYSLFLKEA